MQVRKFGKTGQTVPILGFGSMRMPVLAQNTDQQEANPELDEAAAVKLIRHAIDQGVTYVDTAYGYHGGRSEHAVGLALRDGYRERTYLTTKFPTWEWKQDGDFDRIFGEQLTRLQTDSVDGYIFHALNRDSWENICLKNGLLDKMIAAKKAGKVRWLGFSFHDSLDVFTSIIDATDVWDFCQIQFNYLDTDFQAGLAGMRYAHARGLAVIVMEPLRGGKLANLPPEAAACFADTGRTPVEWALNFVWNCPEVSLVLSGMGNEQMVDENVAIANRASAHMLTVADRAIIAQAQQTFQGDNTVPCTACEYCLPCPFGVAIPYVFQTYNNLFKDKSEAECVKQYTEWVRQFGKTASACTACRACEPKCPQQIVISERMKDVVAKFETIKGTHD